MARKSKTILKLDVTVEMPKGANVPMVIDYIRRAILSESGSGDPDDPMFGAFKNDRHHMTISLREKKTTYA